MRVAVTGGTGYLGAHTVRALLDAGHSVRLLVTPDEGTAPVVGTLPELGEVAARKDIGLGKSRMGGSCGEPAGIESGNDGRASQDLVAYILRHRRREENAVAILATGQPKAFHRRRPQ